MALPPPARRQRASRHSASARSSRVPCGVWPRGASMAGAQTRVFLTRWRLSANSCWQLTWRWPKPGALAARFSGSGHHSPRSPVMGDVWTVPAGGGSYPMGLSRSAHKWRRWQTPRRAGSDAMGTQAKPNIVFVANPRFLRRAEAELCPRGVTESAGQRHDIGVSRGPDHPPGAAVTSIRRRALHSQDRSSRMIPSMPLRYRVLRFHQDRRETTRRSRSKTALHRSYGRASRHCQRFRRARRAGDRLLRSRTRPTLEDVDRAGDDERGQDDRAGRLEHHEQLGPGLDR